MQGQCSIFSGMQILYDKQWLSSHAVVIEGGLIKAIIPEEMIQHHLPAQRYEFPSDCYLVPGLIDLHIHGIQGRDVMDANVDALQNISHSLAAQGVTGFLATTMTASNEQIEAVLKTIPGAMTTARGAAILGVHLEGPFIASSKNGAQDAHTVQLPDINLISRWQSLSGNAIKLITLAPELPGAIEFIKVLRERDIIVSIGHTNATYSETQAAIEAGCTQATHLFNAMRGMHQREPGALGALLLSEEIIAEVIADGYHVHPAMLEVALKLKSAHRLLLVTDAMRAACMNDGKYELGNQLVQVENGRATLIDGTLAGSTLRLPQAIKNMLNYTSCTLIEALQMATENPARILGLTQKGVIEVGNDADLAIFDQSFTPLLTICQGELVYQQ